jgi:hypothetical protein
VNANELKLNYNATRDEYECYFPNVRSLTICHQPGCDTIQTSQQVVDFLALIVNLSNVQYLRIFNLEVENLTCVLLEILKQTPKSSSLYLRSCGLQVFINNVELCNYLNKNIQVFDCRTRSLFKSFDEVRVFCEISC